MNQSDPPTAAEPERVPDPLRPMLNIEQVMKLIPVARSTIFRMEKQGLFPPSVYISPNRRLWYEDDIRAWQIALPRNSRLAELARRRAKKRVADRSHI